MMKHLLPLALVAAGTFAGSAIADQKSDAFADPQAAIEARQSIHRLMDINLNDAVAMLMGQKPFDGVTLVNRVENLHQLSLMGHDHFDVPGSFEGSNARPEILAQIDDYKDYERALTIATHGLYTGANNRDPKHIKPALQQTFQACQSCHEKYMKSSSGE